MMEAQQGATKNEMKRHSNTDLVVREDILAKARELAAMLATTDEVITYQNAEKRINESDRIQKMISVIKKKQKEIVAFEQFQNAKMVEKIEGEMKDLQDELDNLPIVQQFQQTQTDINYLLQLIISVIKDTLSDKINVETGQSAPPTSCND